MPDPLLDAVLNRIDQAQAASMRLGAVTAVDTGDASLTVDLAGDSVSGVRWVSSYSPTVADFVVIGRVGSTWVVFGKLSKDLRGSTTVYSSKIDLPWTAWQYTGTWARPVNGVITQRASGGASVEAGYVVYAAASSGALPSGATVMSMKLTVERATQADDDGQDLVTPVLYGVSYAPDATPVGAPATVGGFGPWSPGTLAFGSSAQWDVPSTWATAILAGTLTGFMVKNATVATNGAFTVGGILPGLSFALQTYFSI